jgi:DNA-binding IclR family transcriptional regulator
MTSKPRAEPAGPAGPAGPTAAGKVLGVLGAFATDAPELTLSAIARKAGLALSTAHRLVAELVAWGALERGGDGRYRIGLRLYEVGALAPRGVALRDAAMPFMEDLYEVTHEVVQLAVREGSELVFVERLAGRTSVGVHTRVGLRFPLPASGAGLVLLAFAPNDVQEAVLAGPFERFTEKTLTDPVRLRAILAEARRQEIAVSDGQVTLDSLSVGAPVRDASGTVVAAVSVVVHAGSVDPAFLIPLVRTAARGMSRSLAGPSALREATAYQTSTRARRESS